jgi:cytoskeleton protein RodZ
MSAAIAEKEKTEGIQLAVPGLGERLKSARLAQDMELEKMAARIHLTSAAVEALECDDYSDMPARVFVRGYIRNYARTVGLPIDSILAQFDRLWPDEASTVHIHPEPRLAADTEPGNRWPNVVSWLVLLVLLVLFLIWWQGYLDRFIDDWRGAQKAQAPVEAVESPVGRGLVGPGQLTLPQLDAGPEEEPAQPDDSPVPPDLTAAMADEGIAPESPPADAAATEAGPAPAAASAGAEQTQAAVSQPEAGTSQTTAPAASQAVADSGIVVRFSQDSWVDIRDATRTFKLFGTMKAGTEHRLGGEPPYKAVIGNAGSVAISVAGKDFDLAPYTVSNVARFTLAP